MATETTPPGESTPEPDALPLTRANHMAGNPSIRYMSPGNITVSDTPLPARAEADAAILSELAGTVNLSANPEVISGHITESIQDDTLPADVIPAPELSQQPFSEIAIAERLASDPDYYRRLFRFSADELKHEVVHFEAKPGEGNSAGVISAELIQFQRGFEAAATDLESANPDRFTRAAKTIVAIRDSIGRFCEHSPALVRPFLQIAAVTAGCYVLHQVGVPEEMGVLISFAIVRNEKLADLLHGAAKDDASKFP